MLSRYTSKYNFIVTTNNNNYVLVVNDNSF